MKAGGVRFLTPELIDKGFQPKMLIIMWASSVLSFTTALAWNNFVQKTVINIEESGHRPLPSSVSALIAALVLTGAAVGGMYGLYIAANEYTDSGEGKGNAVDEEDTNTDKE